MIRAEFDDRAFQKRLERLKGALPGVVAKALNDTTRQARDELIRELPVAFDRPTPYTLKRAIFAKFTNAQRLEAEVFIADKATKAVPPVRYLAPSVYGGPRHAKALEVQLRTAGLLGSDEWLVPSKFLQLDAYGNPPSGLSKKLLSQLQASFDPKARESAKAKRSRNRKQRKQGGGGRYFIGRPGGDRKKLAIYERIETGVGQVGFGSRVRPVFIVTRAPRYTKRFEVFEIVKRAWNARVRENVLRRLAERAA